MEGVSPLETEQVVKENRDSEVWDNGQVRRGGEEKKHRLVCSKEG